MKKCLLFVLMTALVGVGHVTAQNAKPFEGEFTQKVNSVQKATTQVKTKNILAKAIAKNILKKNVDENPAFYSGVYEAKSIVKGNKQLVYYSYNNSYSLFERNGDIVKTTTYFPYVKKGYYTTSNTAEAKQKTAGMDKGIEKTGKTMTILGRACEVYVQKFEDKQTVQGGTTSTVIHNEYAMTADATLPAADTEYLRGVKGIPMMFTVNSTSQSTSEMVNVDILMSMSFIMTGFEERSVSDSELEVPADIKLYDAAKDPKQVLKISADNKKYMQKKNLWSEKDPDEMKIYDNLSEEWDF